LGQQFFINFERLSILRGINFGRFYCISILSQVLAKLRPSLRYFTDYSNITLISSSNCGLAFSMFKEVIKRPCGLPLWRLDLARLEIEGLKGGLIFNPVFLQVRDSTSKLGPVSVSNK
jgi:hypothetical protein